LDPRKAWGMSSSVSEETLVRDADFRARHELVCCTDEAFVASGWVWAGLSRGRAKPKSLVLPLKGNFPHCPVPGKQH